MEVNRNIEGFGAFQNWPEKLVIKIAAPNVAIDGGSSEAVTLDRSLQFLGGFVWSRGRQCRKSGKAARVAL